MWNAERPSACAMSEAVRTPSTSSRSRRCRAGSGASVRCAVRRSGALSQAGSGQIRSRNSRLRSVSRSTAATGTGRTGPIQCATP
ncbi:hypothetical protein SBADM41S_01223 [Streptomyces badius]